MKDIAYVLAFALASVAAGCASVPTAAEQQAADYGSAIDQATAEAEAVNYLNARLKDPMSAIYTWSAVTPGYLRGAPIVGRKTLYGYILNGTVNSKNSFGGYTGAKPYQFIFHDGAIVYASHQDCSLGQGSCFMAPLN